MKLTRLLLISTISLIGCSSVCTLHRDTDGHIWRVESKGTVKTVIKEDGLEVEQDSRNEPFFKLEIPATKIGG